MGSRGLPAPGGSRAEPWHSLFAFWPARSFRRRKFSRSAAASRARRSSSAACPRGVIFGPATSPTPPATPSRSAAPRRRCLQVRWVAEALGIDLVDVLRAGGPGGEPAVLGDDFQAADGALLPGARVSLAMIGSPASVVSLTGSGDSFCKRAFCSGVAGGVDARVVGRAELARSARGKCSPGSLPVRAVISAASRSRIRPSLSVVQTVPSRRRKLAPALSSPPKQQRAVEQAGDEPLEPHRHLDKLPAQCCHHAVDHAAAHQRLAHRRARLCQSRPVGRAGSRWPRPGNDWGSSAPPSGVTMPWRSESGSLAKATSNRSFSAISPAMA